MPHTILIIDDDESARSVARTLLENAGFEVAVAHDGRDAPHTLTSMGKLPAAIVLDARMPVMNGQDFLQVLRSYHRFNEVPVIAQSAFPLDPELARRCKGVVAKQRMAETLVPTVRALARGTLPPIDDKTK